MDDSPISNLNAAVVAVVPRKRVGRPRKTSAQSQPAEAPVATTSKAALTTDDASGGSCSVGADLDITRTLDPSPTLSECRRSSRKKIIKFDVRDLLNKNRKQHKIQIEARIDSNAPPAIAKTATATTPAAIPATTPATGAATGNRRFSMFETGKKPTPLVPVTPPMPVHALELFAKPKATQSLIVAQVSSTEEKEKQVHSTTFLNLLSPHLMAPIAFAASGIPLGARKRGRPRKKLSANIQTEPKKRATESPSTPLVEVAVAAAASIKSETIGSPEARSFSYSDSDTTSTCTSNGSSEFSEGQPNSRHKLRVKVKRIKDMSAHTSSSDSDSISLSPSVTVVDVSNSSSSLSGPRNRRTKSAAAGENAKKEQLLLAVQDENALDVNLAQETPQATTEIKTGTGDLDVDVLPESNSDSQIIFVEIEPTREKQAPKEKVRETDQSSDASEDLTDFQEFLEQRSDKLRPEAQAIKYLMDKFLDRGPRQESGSTQHSSPGAKRRSQRAGGRPSDNAVASQGTLKKMTLEETFAEIAAKSSEQIKLEATEILSNSRPEMGDFGVLTKVENQTIYLSKEQQYVVKLSKQIPNQVEKTDQLSSNSTQHKNKEVNKEEDFIAWLTSTISEDMSEQQRQQQPTPALSETPSTSTPSSKVKEFCESPVQSEEINPTEVIQPPTSDIPIDAPLQQQKMAQKTAASECGFLLKSTESNAAEATPPKVVDNVEKKGSQVPGESSSDDKNPQKNIGSTPGMKSVQPPAVSCESQPFKKIINKNEITPIASQLIIANILGTPTSDIRADSSQQMNQPQAHKDALSGSENSKSTDKNITVSKHVYEKEDSLTTATKPEQTKTVQTPTQDIPHSSPYRQQKEVFHAQKECHIGSGSLSSAREKIGLSAATVTCVPKGENIKKSTTDVLTESPPQQNKNQPEQQKEASTEKYSSNVTESNNVLPASTASYEISLPKQDSNAESSPNAHTELKRPEAMQKTALDTPIDSLHQQEKTETQAQKDEASSKVKEIVVSDVMSLSSTSDFNDTCVTNNELQEIKPLQETSAGVPTDSTLQQKQQGKKHLAGSKYDPSTSDSPTVSNEGILQSELSFDFPSVSTGMQSEVLQTQALDVITDLPVQQQTKQLPTQKESPPGSGAKQQRPVTFFECDALFKAMDKASAQIRLGEKSKKKLKQEAKKPDSKVPGSGVKSTDIGSCADIIDGNSKADFQLDKISGSPPPSRGASSDSSRVSTPCPSETGVAKRPGGRSNNKKPIKLMATSRRNTMFEERIAMENAGSNALMKRRNSVHPKVSPSPTSTPRSSTSSPMPSEQVVDSTETHKQKTVDEPQKLDKTNKSSLGVSKKKRKKAPNYLLRQDSLDSTSSASQSAFKQQSKPMRKRKANDALQLALIETESSESTSSSSKMPRFLDTSAIHTPAPSSPATTGTSPELEAPDPLKDIAKFIEDGVNLLKRDYKLDDDDDVNNVVSTISASSSPKTDVNNSDSMTLEFEKRVAQMETPAITPEPTPAPSPSPSPMPSNSEDLPVGNSGVRRSHRIKQKPQGPKASVGRGVVRDTDRICTGDDGEAVQPAISMEDQLTELAHIEAINEAFLRNEGLNTFKMIRENFYQCARQVSQENAEMQCDCFLTGDEEAQGHLCCGAGCINRMLMIECGPLCTNGDRCTNKRFQKRQCWPCRVFRTEKKGCGITAELQIPPGEFVMEYVGEVIDSEEFERRQYRYSKDKNRHYYFMALRGEAIIDATAKGNISRYINHSCDPNAETQKWTVNGELRIGFFSRKTIMPGEEITFDYQYQRYGRDAQRCYCEAANCRGWIGGEPDSDEGEQLGESESEEEYEEGAEAVELESNDDSSARRKSLSGRKQLKDTAKSKARLSGKLATRKQRKEQQPKVKDREYKAGRWLRPSGEKSARKPSKVKFRATLEDPDVLEELSVLSRCGLKNQVDTLRFSRCMVRAKLPRTRIQLLGILTRGEMPCRRLFLDYHGLRLLHAWMNENGNEQEMLQALLDALESLPIPNKTMLNESRVYQSVKTWSTLLEKPTEASADAALTPSSQPSTAASSPTSTASPSCIHILSMELVQLRSLTLLQKWDALPEIFRIPKRERFEQMKEHEREADRQYAATALEESSNASALSSSDRYRQDRFRRDTSSRYVKPKTTLMSGNNTICTITTQSKDGRNTPNSSNLSGNGNGGSAYKGEARRRSEISSSERPKTISKELRREMFERKVAQDEAEKRVSSEDWREHEVRCEYFGAELTTDPKLLPFYHITSTDEWFNSDDVQVPAPSRCGTGVEKDVAYDEPSGSTDVADYKLPASVEPLPPSWHWSVTAEGNIYYYNLRERISQWEPPSVQQRMQTLAPSPTNEASADYLPWDVEKLLVNIDLEHVGSLSPKSLTEYIEGKIRERREIRRSRLVSVCVISPRRDEDRIYNQIESRKYKENKEKIRRRKEVYRRRRTEAATAQTDAPAPDSTGARGPLPIQGYLFSSDEETEVADADTCGANISTLPLIDVIVEGDKIVDELDALNSRRHGRLALPMPPLSLEPSTSKSALAALASLAKKPPTMSTTEVKSVLDANYALAATISSTTTPAKRKLLLPMPPLPEYKRHRLEKRRKNISTTAITRGVSDKFRSEISAHVAEFLRPYRKESCHVGRITCEEDYKFLIKRLSHHITTKEMRYCDVTGNNLACTESVKHKSYDFINQYMHKKGRVYKRPVDEPDY
ncbi:probable histone-lysine N-methyltransferase CG1716 [Scaptodrosophila lebanonensis]|uniref:[histone H3]-lysine(36) N-trimethyltransferase n=1 Tax=Drosophila lebanonensis TaxID=7225 RepID=A0A6J2UHK7_DROLE|nr:probable histone-lysine N-methyltransferase CG1716 [Scaptodrosophila lebanonensis]XP_030386647.1 probable histone-lysine N-methyltransferase CG1716 [Scaptodrosophila lebanonensis]